MGLLEVGDKAPEVAAKDADGNDVSLSDLQGRWVSSTSTPRTTLRAVRQKRVRF